MAERLDVFWHEDILLHKTGRGVFERPPSPLLSEHEPHPENLLRVRNMKAILERGPLSEHVRWREGRRADPAELELVHDPGYVESIRLARPSSPASVFAPTRSSGPRAPCATGAGRRLLPLQQRRPRGRARAEAGVARAAIVDWDAHHGNGTQECFYAC